MRCSDSHRIESVRRWFASSNDETVTLRATDRRRVTGRLDTGHRERVQLSRPLKRVSICITVGRYHYNCIACILIESMHLRHCTVPLSVRSITDHQHHTRHASRDRMRDPSRKTGPGPHRPGTGELWRPGGREEEALVACFR